jgi:hypothetical protein
MERRPRPGGAPPTQATGCCASRRTRRAQRGSGTRESSVPQLARGPSRRVDIAAGALRAAGRDARDSDAGRGPAHVEERVGSGNFTDAPPSTPDAPAGGNADAVSPVAMRVGRCAEPGVRTDGRFAGQRVSLHRALARRQGRLAAVKCLGAGSFLRVPLLGGLSAGERPSAGEIPDFRYPSVSEALGVQATNPEAPPSEAGRRAGKSVAPRYRGGRRLFRARSSARCAQQGHK